MRTGQRRLHQILGKMLITGEQIAERSNDGVRARTSH
jgi:hypothetical protein